MKLAQRLAAMPTRALVETRRLLRAAASSELDAQLDAERDAQSAMGRTHDYIEGVTAFLQKRPPQFKGEWCHAQFVAAPEGVQPLRRLGGG